MEICDVYDASGTRTGQAVTRGTELAEGAYYLVVQVWIRDENGEYLVQQRAPHLKSNPDIWATTAGYILTAEASLAGAIREVNEELGIQLSPPSLRHWQRLITGHLLQDVWLAEVSHPLIGTPVLGPDVADWKWAAKHELQMMINRGQFFAYSYFAQLPD